MELLLLDERDVATLNERVAELQRQLTRAKGEQHRQRERAELWRHRCLTGWQPGDDDLRLRRAQAEARYWKQRALRG